MTVLQPRVSQRVGIGQGPEKKEKDKFCRWFLEKLKFENYSSR
jgi:hypothetical protein